MIHVSHYIKFIELKESRLVDVWATPSRNIFEMVNNIIIRWAAWREKVHSVMRRFRSMRAKYHLGFLSILIESVISNCSVSRQWRPWWDCADIQGDLCFRCQHMPEDTILHVTTCICTPLVYRYSSAMLIGKSITLQRERVCFYKLVMWLLTLVMQNKLSCHAHFQFSTSQITWSRLLI